jgi:hypothetical protein
MRAHKTIAALIVGRQANRRVGCRAVTGTDQYAVHQHRVRGHCASRIFANTLAAILLPGVGSVIDTMFASPALSPGGILEVFTHLQ